MQQNWVTEVKKEYPGLRDLADNQLISYLQEAVDDPNRKQVLFVPKRLSVTPTREYYTRSLDQWQLPEGWGNFLLSLTQPLMEAISLSSAAIDVYLNDPYLPLLLKVLLVYSFATKPGHKDLETSILTRRDNLEILRENAQLGTLVLNAQELLGLLSLMPKLRNGGMRLFQRVQRCIDALLLENSD